MNNKSLTIWTMIAHSLILIGAGHGVMNIIVLEVVYILSLFNTTDIAHEWAWIVLPTIAGQILMITSLIVKSYSQKIIKLTGVLLLFGADILLIISPIDTRLFTAVVSLPFMICATILIVQELKAGKLNKL